MIGIPVIGAFLEASGTIIEKKILRMKGINYKNYVLYSFVFIVAIMLPFLYWFWDIKSEAFLLKNVLIMFVVGIFAVIGNLLIFYSLKREDVTEFEPAWLMQPLFTVLLAFLFYQSERNWILVILAMVASLSLVLSHVKKHHLKMNKYFIAVVAGSFFFALELVLSKLILDYYSPIMFYFVRCLLVLMVVAIVYRKDFKIKVKNKGKIGGMAILVALIWIIYRAIIYYGYEKSGIVFTTMIFILSPVFMFIMAVVFLKEKPTLRQIVSTIIIIVCVATALVLNN